jgi:hypothetical protein
MAALLLDVVQSLLQHASAFIAACSHRPPTGPLTSSQAADAEELRQETLAKNDERIEREHEEAGRESNSSS